MSTTRRIGEELPRRSLRSHYDSEEAAESGSGSGQRTFADDSDAEDSPDARPELEDALRVHDELVAYVHSLNGHVERRSSVWIEHSYARARTCIREKESIQNENGMQNDFRVLLVRRTPRCPDCHPAHDSEPLDVESIDHEPTPPPSIHHESDDTDEEIDCNDNIETEMTDWEDKILSLAPTVAHRKLAVAALDVLHSLRLARLASDLGTRQADATRAHARQLRRTLAPFWEWRSSPQQKPAAWLHSVFSAYLPPVFRALYTKLVSELRRVVPRLCEGLLAGRLPPPARDLLAMVEGPRVLPSPARPLLVWLPSGRERLDERWERRLRILLPVHRIRAPTLENIGVEAWCAGVAGAARAALSAVDAPRSLLVLGGIGAGAALALQLVGVPVPGKETARALVLLAPPLLTAEGPRDTPDDPMLETPHPMLLVIGQNAMQSNATIASSIAERRQSSGRRARLVVAGSADDLLRLSARTRRYLKLPQHALDAAVADECARWIHEMGEGEAGPQTKRARPQSPTPLPVTPTTPSHENVSAITNDTVEIVQLPVTHRTPVMTARVTDTPPTSTDNASNSAVVRCVRGGIITRGRGGTPLSLPPPRRRTTQATPSPAPTTTLATPIDLTGHDILDLPIVFADDNNETAPSVMPTSMPSGSVTMSHVTITPTKERKFSKVILAKRAGGASSGSGVRPIVVRSGSSVRFVKRSNT